MHLLHRCTSIIFTPLSYYHNILTYHTYSYHIPIVKKNTKGCAIVNKINESPLIGNIRIIFPFYSPSLFPSLPSLFDFPLIFLPHFVINSAFQCSSIISNPNSKKKKSKTAPWKLQFYAI